MKADKAKENKLMKLLFEANTLLRRTVEKQFQITWSNILITEAENEF